MENDAVSSPGESGGEPAKGPVLSVEPPKSLQRAGRSNGGGAWTVLLLLVVIGLQAALVYRFFFSAPTGASGGEPVGDVTVDLGAMKSTALRLEEHGAMTAAAETWERYLGAGGGGDAPARALVRYRAGKLYQEAKDYERALVAYVLAEKEGLADAGAKRTIGTRTVDCLRALGRYGAIGSELDRRTRASGGKADPASVVASFAGETLTRPAFDRLVEREVDGMMRQMAGRIPPEQMAAQRTRMLRFYREPANAERFLEQWVVQKLMARRAREQKLDREEAFVERLQEVEGLLLTQSLQKREIDGKIEPTDADLESYFRANESDYRKPAEATLRIIAVADEAAGKAKLVALAAGGVDAFKAAAKDSAHAPSKDDGGLVKAPLVKGQAWPGFGSVGALEGDVFAAAPGTTLDKVYTVGEQWLLVHVESRREAADQPFADVRDRVTGDYTQRKRRELMEALIAKLKKEYNVRIDVGAATAGPESAAGAKDGAKDGAKSGKAGGQ